MIYNIVYTRRANKAFRGMSKDASKAIRKKIEHIAAAPFASHHNVTRLQGREGYRLRCGVWRIIYEIQQETIVILVLEIGLRKEVYR